MEDILSILINASRPYIPFTVKVGDKELNLLARKPGNTEESLIGKVWGETYEATLNRLDAIVDDKAALFRNFQRQTNEKLAEYISKAEKIDLIPDARTLCGDKPSDHPDVIAKLDELVAAREQEIVTKEREELLNMAMDRRKIIQAIIEANEASLHSQLKYLVYTDVDKRLVSEDKDLESLPTQVIEDIVVACAKVLQPTPEEVKATDPLPSADSTP